MGGPHVVYSSGINVGCFYLLVIVNSVVMNFVYMNLCEYVFSFFGYIHNSVKLLGHVVTLFKVSRTLQTVVLHFIPPPTFPATFLAFCPRPLELFGDKLLKVYYGFLELVEDHRC